MRLPNNLQEAIFVNRPNRFSAVFELDGKLVTAHVANSGRMRELMVLGTHMYLVPVKSETRKTAYNLVLVKIDGVLVSADSRLPLPLVHEAISDGLLAQFKGYEHVKEEAVFGDSRLDLLLSGPHGLCYIETKSVTLIENGMGLFPDAPTERGTKHMGSLIQAVRKGHRAAVVFVVQREDVRSFSPNEKADQKFGQAFRQALSNEVEAYAYRCAVSMSQISLLDRLPINL